MSGTDDFQEFQAKALEKLKKANENDYVKFMGDAFGLCKGGPGLMKKCLNKVSKVRRKDLKRLGGSGDEGNHQPRPPVQVRLLTKPASELPMICRSDLVRGNPRLYIDVEKVSEAKTHRNVAATVAIVDDDRELIFWAMIKRENICQLFPKITNLSKEKVGTGIAVEWVQQMLGILLPGNTVVGAAVIDDLKSLDFDWIGRNVTVIDIQDYFRDSQGPFRLVDIARAEFPEKADFQCSQHAAIADARMTQKVSKRMEIYKAEGHRISHKPIRRSPKKRFLEVGDRCTCSKTTKKRRPGKGPITNPREYDMS